MRTVMLLVLAAAVAAGSAFAHHSYGATYDVKKEVRLEGKLLQFVYRNPHAYVHMQAKDADGKEQRWAVEWAGTAQLSSAGVNKESLKVGDEIIVTARPSRVPGEYRVLMVNLRRPLDGFTWGARAGEIVD